MKKEALAQAFFCEFGEICRKTFFVEKSGRLPLKNPKELNFWLTSNIADHYKKSFWIEFWILTV